MKREGSVEGRPEEWEVDGEVDTIKMLYTHERKY